MVDTHIKHTNSDISTVDRHTHSDSEYSKQNNSDTLMVDKHTKHTNSDTLTLDKHTQNDSERSKQNNFDTLMFDKHINIRIPTYQRQIGTSIVIVNVVNTITLIRRW